MSCYPWTRALGGVGPGDAGRSHDAWENPGVRRVILEARLVGGEAVEFTEAVATWGE